MDEWVSGRAIDRVGTTITVEVVATGTSATTDSEPNKREQQEPRFQGGLPARRLAYGRSRYLSRGNITPPIGPIRQPFTPPPHSDIWCLRSPRGPLAPLRTRRFC
jgi:hypothetical protein